MTFIQGLLIFFTILFAYLIIIYILKIRGLFEKFNLALYGPTPILMIRTKKGRDFLKKIARKKRFWQAFGTWGIIICISIMIIFTVFLVYSNLSFILFSTPEQRASLPGPEIALAYPGINPALPIETLGYFIIAFVVAVVVHEFSHGILAIACKIKVKSLGLLFMIVPVGAFCEPDDEELKKAEPVKRMKVFAAGPLSNFTVAIVIIILLTFVFMPAVSHVQGVDIFYSLENSPAEEIGLSAGCVITSINDTSVSDLYVFREVMDETYPNQTINITYFRKGEYIKKEVKLTSVYQYNSSNESYKNISFLGIGFNPYVHLFDYVKNPFLNDFPFSFLGLMILPLSSYLIGYNPIAEPFIHAYQIQGPLSAISVDTFWIIFTILFWIFWLNFLVALFNILPMIPLDGGYLFKDAFSLFLKKIFRNITPEKTEKISKNAVLFVSLIVLFVIISQFFIKYI